MFKRILSAQNTDSYNIVRKDNFDMKATLKSLSMTMQYNQTDAIYNYNNVVSLKKQLAGIAPGVNRSYMLSDLAHQYLNSGYPDSAISIIQGLNTRPTFSTRVSFYQHQFLNSVIGSCFNNSYFDASFTHPYRQMGLCYLRMGELENCLACHNAQMCIMPISGTGVYGKRNSTLNAIKYLTKDLAENGEDATTEWLLNIAYSTLGEYPHKVPEEYFIDFNKYSAHHTTVRFEDMAPALGLNTKGLYGGADMEDFNNDGYLDVFTTSGDLKTSAWLYLNNPDSAVFKDVSAKAGLDGITGGCNTIHADYDNDGNVDVYIMRGGWLNGGPGKQPNSLLRNNGDGTFTDVTNKAGLLNYLPSQTASWVDYNNDGLLDLFVGNENAPSFLFKNNGDGTFTEVSKQAGLVINDFVKAAFWGDVNNDGLQDVYISCYQSKNHLFINKGPDAKGNYVFEDQTEKAGVAGPVKSFSTFMADFNNDGWLDIVCFSYYMDMELIASQYKGESPTFEPSKIYINNKNGTFTPLETTQLNRAITAMGLNFGDVDNDGWIDFYVGTGFPNFEALIPNLLFRNIEGKDIEDITFGAGVGHLQKGHGIAMGDIDHDGDLDIYVNIGGVFESDRFTHALFINGGNDNNWVSLKLEGVSSNRSAIGARIEVKVRNNGVGRTIYRWVNTGGSYGANPLEQLIGLGKADVIDELNIFWPKTGRTQHFSHIQANKAYKIAENSPDIITLPYKKIDLRKAGNDTKNCTSM
ncbi:MAG TPA: CRTAC1 family protein [Chitinophagales bacterium]|nr:CRTAC1 family protein [Chitinophagales bacterium]